MATMHHPIYSTPARTLSFTHLDPFFPIYVQNRPAVKVLSHLFIPEMIYIHVNYLDFHFRQLMGMSAIL